MLYIRLDILYKYRTLLKSLGKVLLGSLVWAKQFQDGDRLGEDSEADAKWMCHEGHGTLWASSTEHDRRCKARKYIKKAKLTIRKSMVGCNGIVIKTRIKPTGRS